MIRFDNVTKLYAKDTVALERVNLEIGPGEFVFLVGASGSGKSTMVRLILKEMEPSAGSIYVNGTKLSSVPRRRIPRLRRYIGCVFQDFKLLPNKTVFENVAFGLRNRKVAAEEIRRRVDRVLEMARLQGLEKRTPDQLSGGQQQRVALARALATSPSRFRNVRG